MYIFIRMHYCKCVRDCTYQRGLGVACSSTKAIPGPQLAEQQQCSPAFFVYIYFNYLIYSCDNNSY